MFKHNTIALVFDFDGTLTPQPMQEYTILPEIGIKKGKVFWSEVHQEAIKTGGEEIVTYMRLMLKKSQMRDYPVTRKRLMSLGQKIEYYPGVKTFFNRINKYMKSNYKGIELRHYLISAGLKEIIDGCEIAKYLYKVFASEYYYNEYNQAVFPKVIVNDTLKTQFIFRINKGKENLHENINEYMPTENRPIPFQNILYIGDGLTDVPCMTVIRKNEGASIAVYKPYSPKGKSTCKELVSAKRADFMSKADYRNGSELDKIIKLLLDNIVGGINYGRESYNQMVRYKIKDIE